MEQPRYSDPDRQESIPFQMRIWKWESEPLTDIRSIASKQRSNPLLPASKVAREIAISTVSKRRTMIGEGKDMKVRYQGILDYVHNEMSLHLAEELIAILELNPDLAILPLTYNPVLDELKAKIGATYGDADETTEGVIELAKVQATKNILKKLQGPVYLDYFGKEGLKGMDPIETSEIDDTWRFSTMLEGVSVDYVYPKAKDDPQIKLQIVKV